MIGVLVRRRREAILPELHEVLITLIHDARGEVEGTVETAKPIGDEELSKLEAAASATFGVKVSLRIEVAPGERWFCVEEEALAAAWQSPAE